MKKRVILFVVIIVVAIAAIYFTFFFTRSCGDKACFNSALAECSRVSYLSDIEDGAWFYKIKGKSGAASFNPLTMSDDEIEKFDMNKLL